MMRPEDVGKILEICRRDVEVTLEANPSDIVQDRGKLEGFVNAGVNRISLGIQVYSSLDLLLHTKLSLYSTFSRNFINVKIYQIQTFSAAGLRLLGRDHSSSDAISALDCSISLSPSVSTSVDLIFGRPGQVKQSASNQI